MTTTTNTELNTALTEHERAQRWGKTIAASIDEFVEMSANDLTLALTATKGELAQSSWAKAYDASATKLLDGLRDAYAAERFKGHRTQLKESMQKVIQKNGVGTTILATGLIYGLAPIIGSGILLQSEEGNREALNKSNANNPTMGKHERDAEFVNLRRGAKELLALSAGSAAIGMTLGAGAGLFTYAVVNPIVAILLPNKVDKNAAKLKDEFDRLYEQGVKTQVGDLRAFLHSNYLTLANNANGGEPLNAADIAQTYRQSRS